MFSTKDLDFFTPEEVIALRGIDPYPDIDPLENIDSLPERLQLEIAIRYMTMRAKNKGSESCASFLGLLKSQISELFTTSEGIIDEL